MDIIDGIDQWKKALWSEIKELQNNDNRGVTIEHARCLRKEENMFVYWVTTKYPLALMEGGSVSIHKGKEQIAGIVLSSDQRDCIVKLDTFLGSEFSKGLLVNEPWDLLEQLSKRLEELIEEEKKVNRIKQLVKPSNKIKHPEHLVKNLLHEAYLRSKYNDTTFIWGPPGTGKTYTLARVTAYHYTEGKKILLLSHSNAAVDVLVEEMHHFLQENGKWKKGEVVRYGNSAKPSMAEIADINVMQIIQSENPDDAEKMQKLEKYRRILKNRLQKNFSNEDSRRLTKSELHYHKMKDKLKREESAVVKNARVIATTLSKAAIDASIYEEDFDLVVIDEASMAYVPQVAFAASLAKRVVVCGDFKQLPPISLSYHHLAKKWLKEDIFHISQVVSAVEQKRYHPQLMLLPEQRRMHPVISGFTNRFIYHNYVTDHPDVWGHRENISNNPPFPNKAAVLLNIQSTKNWGGRIHGSKWNLLSSLLTIQLALEAVAAGSTSLGIVTPYREQASWITALIEVFFHEKEIGKKVDIYASTVHRFQGSEKDIVLFDLVDGAFADKPGTLFTKRESDRLINVAVTRARGKFICVGEERFFQKRLSPSKPINHLLHYLKENGHNETAGSHLPVLINKRLRWYRENDYSRLSKDLHASKEKIVVAVNSIEDIPDSIIAVLEEVKNKVNIIILCKQVKTREFLGIKVQLTSSSVPFIGLDEKVLWFGFGEAVLQEKFPFLIRLFSKKLYNQFYKMILEKEASR
ncbi:AAA domain-containing protein [Bacillus seohaeanensis]|uniref:AAA domain-containing protein n=1 Tax=Bacillus seohaeanensis TaxID=284580 RepID=A0ABW5RV26_9BACI